MEINRKRVARRLASGLVAGALALGGLAISGSSVSAKTPIVGSSAVATDGRVGGADRYETATKAADGFLARRGTTGWNAVVVASGSNFPDALSASGLAGALNAPIILLPSNGSMPESVKEWALSRRVQIQTNSALGVPFTVYVVGGESAVPQTSIDTFMSVITKDDTTPAVSKRIAGANRSATAQSVALEKNAAGANLVMSPAKPVFLVNDSSFADALSIAPYAFFRGAPILLTSASSLSVEAQAVLTQYRLLGGSQIVILGGVSAVSTAVEEALVTMGFAYANITRVSGADRYETSVAIADYVNGQNATEFTLNRVTFASGENFADGLAGAPLTGFVSANPNNTDGRVLVLVRSGSVPEAVSDWVAGLSLVTAPTNMYVLGGTSAVSDAVPTAITAATTALNTTSTLTCVENLAGGTVRLTIPGNLSTTVGADGALPTGEANHTLGTPLFNFNQITVNGTAQAAGPIAATGVYNPLTRSTSITMTLSSANPLTPGNVIAWSGLTELQNTVLRRSITGTSCTVADDAVPPSLTIDARVPGANAETGAFYLTFTEPVVTTSVTYEDFVSTSTGVDDFVVTPIGASGGAARVFKVVQGNDANTPDGNTGDNTAVALAANDLITFDVSAATAATDLSGNVGPLADVVKTINAVTDLDVTAATLTGALTCTQGNDVILRNSATGTLRMAADADYGPQGVNGNLYSFKVTNVRGQLIPKVTVDDTAKTIVLTADLAYSTANDVVRSMLNDGIVAWDFSNTAGAGVALGATQANLAAATYVTAQQVGAQTCVTTVTASENIQVPTSLTAAIVVAGVQYGGTAAITQPATVSPNTQFVIASPATGIPLPVAAGSVSITLSGSVLDVAGNASLVGLTI